MRHYPKEKMRTTPGAETPPSVWPCFDWGLPSQRVTPLLVSFYLTVSPVPKHNQVMLGGLISVALSPDHSELPLAANLPYKVPTFLQCITHQRSSTKLLHLNSKETYLMESLHSELYFPHYFFRKNALLSSCLSFLWTACFSGVELLL